MPRRALAFLSGTARAQEASGIRVAFSLDTLFWRSKRKHLACQCENWFLNKRRVSDTLEIRYHMKMTFHISCLSRPYTRRTYLTLHRIRPYNRPYLFKKTTQSVTPDIQRTTNQQVINTRYTTAFGIAN